MRQREGRRDMERRERDGARDGWREEREENGEER